MAARSSPNNCGDEDDENNPGQGDGKPEASLQSLLQTRYPPKKKGKKKSRRPASALESDPFSLSSQSSQINNTNTQTTEMAGQADTSDYGDQASGGQGASATAGQSSSVPSVSRPLKNMNLNKEKTPLPPRFHRAEDVLHCSDSSPYPDFIMNGGMLPRLTRTSRGRPVSEEEREQAYKSITKGEMLDPTSRRRGVRTEMKDLNNMNTRNYKREERPKMNCVPDEELLRMLKDAMGAEGENGEQLDNARLHHSLGMDHEEMVKFSQNKTPDKVMKDMLALMGNQAGIPEGQQNEGAVRLPLGLQQGGQEELQALIGGQGLDGGLDQPEGFGGLQGQRGQLGGQGDPQAALAQLAALGGLQGQRGQLGGQGDPQAALAQLAALGGLQGQRGQLGGQGDPQAALAQLAALGGLQGQRGQLGGQGDPQAALAQLAALGGLQGQRGQLGGQGDPQAALAQLAALGGLQGQRGQLGGQGDPQAALAQLAALGGLQGQRGQLGGQGDPQAALAQLAALGGLQDQRGQLGGQGNQGQPNAQQMDGLKEALQGMDEQTKQEILQEYLGGQEQQEQANAAAQLAQFQEVAQNNPEDLQRLLAAGGGRPGIQMAGQEEEEIDPNQADPNQVIQQLLTLERMKARKNNSPKSQGMCTVIIVDTSGSMDGEPLESAGQFITDFLNNLEEFKMEYQLEENVAILSVGHDIQVVQHLTTDYQLLRQATDTLYAEGPSPLHMGMLLPLGVLNADPSNRREGICETNGHSIVPRIILISDGNPSSVPDDPRAPPNVRTQGSIELRNLCAELTHKQVEQTMSRVYCIPMGQADVEFLNNLAGLTGGKTVQKSDCRAMSRSFLHHTVAGKAKMSRRQINDKAVVVDIVKSEMTSYTDADVDAVWEILQEGEPNFEEHDRMIATHQMQQQQELQQMQQLQQQLIQDQAGGGGGAGGAVGGGPGFGPGLAGVGMPGQQAGRGGQQLDLAGQHLGLHGQQQELGGQQFGLRGQQMGLPGQQMGLPGQQMGLPGQQMGLPGQQMGLHGPAFGGGGAGPNFGMGQRALGGGEPRMGRGAREGGYGRGGMGSGNGGAGRGGGGGPNVMEHFGLGRGQ